MRSDNLFIVGDWTVDPDLDLISRGERSNCVAELRHQFDIDAGSSSSVQTIPKKGHRLVGDIHLANGAVDTAANSDQFPVRQRLVRPSVSAYKQLSTSQIIMPPVSSSLEITADDSRLYFLQFVDGELTPSQLAQSGGEAMPLTLATYDKDSIAGSVAGIAGGR